jgi:hypothetical protein
MYLAQKDPYAVLTKTPHMNSDRVLEEYVTYSPWPKFAVHVPSLVLHVGAVSAAQMGDGLHSGRTTRNWRGEAFDARQLFAEERQC